MKGKFRFHFKDGTSIVDRNRFKTMAQANEWKRAHNRSNKVSSRERIVKVTTIKRKPATQRTSKNFGFNSRNIFS